MTCVSVLARSISALFFIAALRKLHVFDCASAKPNITVQPVSINTTLNSTVVFSCEGTGDELTVRVNGEQATSKDVMDKGFSVTTTRNTSGITRAELQAIAYDNNNNTKVECLAITFEPEEKVSSNTALFMIQGLLDSVVDPDYTYINGSSVLLTWAAPYTLDNVPITGYYIVNRLVNITVTTNNNNTNFTLSATNPNPCILNNVSVSPINDVGIGLSNNISIRGRNSFNLTFDNYTETDVTLHFNILQCTGEAPLNITVIIQCNETGVILMENAEQGSVPIPLNQKCNISISEAGSTFIPTTNITIPPIKSSSSSLSVTPTLTPTASPKTPSSGIISVAVVSVVFFVLLILCCLMLICHRNIILNKFNKKCSNNKTNKKEKCYFHILKKKFRACRMEK